jgi:hypothetical protein
MNNLNSYNYKSNNNIKMKSKLLPPIQFDINNIDDNITTKFPNKLLTLEDFSFN